MDTLPAGKIGSGQPAAIKRPQKLSAPGGIGPRRAASLRNTTLLHDRGFITARWQLIGGTLLYRLPHFHRFVELLGKVAQGLADVRIQAAYSRDRTVERVP